MVAFQKKRKKKRPFEISSLLFVGIFYGAAVQGAKVEGM